MTFIDFFQNVLQRYRIFVNVEADKVFFVSI